jgi:hypothetical protein
MPNINRLCYTDILESSRSYWKILKLAVPVGLETIFQTLFGLIDQVIVGLLGAGAVAGIGLSNSVSFRRFGKRLRHERRFCGPAKQGLVSDLAKKKHAKLPSLCRLWNSMMPVARILRSCFTATMMISELSTT